jgi:hypothetical protein
LYTILDFQFFFLDEMLKGRRHFSQFDDNARLAIFGFFHLGGLKRFIVIANEVGQGTRNGIPTPGRLIGPPGPFGVADRIAPSGGSRTFGRRLIQGPKGRRQGGDLFFVLGWH